MARTWTREHAINLQTRRKAQRWTLDQLASKAGLTVDVVQKLERADEMDLEDEEVLRQLASALGVLPKQLCNSPLRPDPKGALPATDPSAANSATNHGTAGPVRGSGAWAVVTVALILFAAAIMPGTCQRYRSFRDPAPVIGSQSIDVFESKRTFKVPSTPAAKVISDSEVIDGTLVAALEAPASIGVSERMVAVLAAPIAQVDAALEEQAAAPESLAAERLVMILVLGADPVTVKSSLGRFLQHAIEAENGQLPWPADSIEAAIALGASDSVDGAAPVIEAYLDDTARPDAERTSLKDALNRAKQGPRKQPADVKVPQASAITALESGSDDLTGTARDLLAPSPDAAPDAGSEAEVDPLDAFMEAMQSKPADAAGVTAVIAQAQEAAEAGNQGAVCAQLAAWLKRIPAGVIMVSDVNGSSWRMLGWTLFPGDAPVWEQAFGTNEERWLILVVAKLLDGAAG